MTLRTPRRRISPRTKRRYRAIREFFRRALGSSSQPDIKISSSIAVNVTDLKRKIVGLEQQLDEVNKHCQDLACLDCSRKDSESFVHSDDVHHDIATIKEQTEPSSERKSNGIETELLYKTSECNYRRKSEESDFGQKPVEINDVAPAQGMLEEYQEHIPKLKNKKSKHGTSDYSAKIHKHRTKSAYENLAATYSTSSFRSLANPRPNDVNPGYSGHLGDRKRHKEEYAESIPTHQPYKEKKHRDHMKRSKIEHFKEAFEPRPVKPRKPKHQTRELDQDFIADIIRRQYKPVKMFGRKESDLSQFSAPVCRDQEYPVREDTLEGTELCSCCYDVHKHMMRRNDLNEMRSICDTRLYSSKKHKRAKHRRMLYDMYNNTDMYDVVPVKEKTSPKSRRKFAEENAIPYPYASYREVPPSPRTMRPRLNLQAQYNTEGEEYVAPVHQRHRRNSPRVHRRQRERVDTYDSDVTSEPTPVRVIEQPRRPNKRCQVEKHEQCPHDNGAAPNSVQSPPYTNEPANTTVETTFNKTQDTEVNGNVDKTGKALGEIKDILQNFLHEIKKETITSQCDKSDITSKTDNVTAENSTDLNAHVQNSRHGFNHFNIGQCGVPPVPPYITPFTNPCCYPMVPVCPMNCPIPMQNGYVLASQSYTCTNCANLPKEPSCHEHCCSKNTNTAATCRTETSPTETDELIKEIYKFVAQGPARKKDQEDNNDKNEPRRDYKTLTTRSVGESSKLSKHDAKVGTAPLKCYSKSCEAIGSRLSSDPYYTGTNASYSDTVLEKLSLEISTTETETYTETDDKSKPNKFSKVLRSIGLLKKKKRDAIEELSESESAIDVEVKPRSPYRQEVASYMMHGQEFYQPPPVPHHYRPNEYQPDYHPPYNPGVAEYPPPPPPPHHPHMHDVYDPRSHHPRLREHATAPPFHPKQRPTAPPYHSSYDNHYSHMQPPPQMPLCLKEIEVKSIGTQSERKVSLLSKIKRKMQPPSPVASGDDDSKNCSTQTQPIQMKLPPPKKPLFNWKKLQAKAMEGKAEQKNYVMEFSQKAQKEIAEGDQKIRNAMMKRLFHKRNPFSPRNMIVRTLLGKDKASYGNPNVAFKPRMFF